MRLGPRIPNRPSVPEPVVEADAKHVRGKAIVNTIERYAGKCRACGGGAGASRSGVGSLAEIRVEILRRNRPRAAQDEFDSTAGYPAGGGKVLAPAEGGGGLRRPHRSVAERAVV